MNRIQMKTPLVEMDGDEMTRVLWAQIKEKLLLPFVDLKTEYYDLGLPHRDETGDRVTVESAEATKRLGVAVKCATITPNTQRMSEYNLHEMWKSPNGTIRAILDGTVFRAPIQVEGIRPVVRTWEQPITIARHAYGDIYKNSELQVPGAGTAELVFTAEDGTETRKLIQRFDGPGILQGVHNLDRSIESFARSCFAFALDQKQDLWFSAKDTISKTYDARFRDIFQEIYDREYREAFEDAGITYFYTLIDDAVARVIRSKGGFIWACKNYDGDVMSDMLATAFGSLAMMTSVLVSPDGQYEYEAAHGTVTRHYYRYLKGESTSTNPTATIFAWSGALRKRGELDELDDLVDFADLLEEATIATIESGVMTRDLALLWEGEAEAQPVDSTAFLDAIAAHIDNYLSETDAEGDMPDFEHFTLVDDEGREEDFVLVYRTVRDEEEYAVMFSAEDAEKVLVVRCVYEDGNDDAYHFAAPEDGIADDVFAEFMQECPEFFASDDEEEDADE